MGAAGTAGETGGAVQQPVAQRLGLGDREGGVVVQEVVWVQASRSIAVSAQSSQAWLMSDCREGKCPMPVSFLHRMRFSTRAWVRCRASSQACCPTRVVVANAV